MIRSSGGEYVFDLSARETPSNVLGDLQARAEAAVSASPALKGIFAARDSAEVRLNRTLMYVQGLEGQVAILKKKVENQRCTINKHKSRAMVLVPEHNMFKQIHELSMKRA